MTNSNTWVVKTEQDNKTGELYLPLPTDLLAQMGWSEGTELFWELEDSHWILREKKKDGTSSSE